MQSCCRQNGITHDVTDDKQSTDEDPMHSFGSDMSENICARAGLGKIAECVDTGV